MVNPCYDSANPEACIKARRDWINILFLTLTPLIGVVGTALYTWHSGFHLWMPILTIGMYLLVGFSICAGYHAGLAMPSSIWKRR